MLAWWNWGEYDNNGRVLRGKTTEQLLLSTLKKKTSALTETIESDIGKYKPNLIILCRKH